MMRKKKRQSEREVEIALKNQVTWSPKDEGGEEESASRHVSDTEPKLLGNDLTETGKGSQQIDLNCQPEREEEVGLSRVSMMSLVQVASQPLEIYMKQNGLTSLISEQVSEGQLHEVVAEDQSQNDEQCEVEDQTQNDPI